ncbi:unnamed protein product [Darwinula stevensoni]|uniref:Germinal-center associated nuclear protein n=1 Tax=Darwinula stevensoni TaxID=69355 RepID=A0A7R8X2D1_9CRUS|nr:unnamed protein product [Darwinula stevensoni]CAG0883177.1 unnamed protein product [Darwinula stevensoni]
MFDDYVFLGKAEGEQILLKGEALTAIRSIICRSIPKELNNKAALYAHFATFGQVTRIIPLPSKDTAYIHFSAHEEAAKAKKKGSVISAKYPPVKIMYSLTKRDKERFDVEASTSLPATGGRPLVDYRNSIFSTDPQKEDEGPKTGVDSGGVFDDHQMMVGDDVNKLREVLSRSAHSPKEKFFILDTRDRIIRLCRVKEMELSKAVALKGTCLDMCPEKERYLRIDRKRVSPFEHPPPWVSRGGETDERCMVKEYSRSSADQEEPLPHELRPPPILSLTMDYLLANFMDQFNPDNLGDWYFFLWDRTRSIRKDITQQQLCDLTSVGVMEKCVRFHIYASMALSGQDMFVFDPKINNENLTKSLKTLKDMYSELHLKGILCAREPEFRGYDILLNLHQGDIFRQIQELTESLRSTGEVKFAISIALAFTSRNYVRFFKLVAKASYMNACILLRYFNQVRSHALRTVVRAFCPGSKGQVQLPVEDIRTWLGFGSHEETQEFCESHGLCSDDHHVLLDRSLFEIPAALQFSRHSLDLIHEKLDSSSIAKVVNGGEMPKNPLEWLKIHTSFGADGKLVQDALSSIHISSSAVSHQVSFTYSHSVSMHPSHPITPPHPVSPPRPVPINPSHSVTSPHLVSFNSSHPVNPPHLVSFNPSHPVIPPHFPNHAPPFGVCGATTNQWERKEDTPKPSVTMSTKISSELAKFEVFNSFFPSSLESIIKEVAEEVLMEVHSALTIAIACFDELAEEAVLYSVRVGVEELLQESSASQQLTEELLQETLFLETYLLSGFILMTETSIRAKSRVMGERAVKKRFWQRWRERTAKRRSCTLAFPSHPSLDTLMDQSSAWHSISPCQSQSSATMSSSWTRILDAQMVAAEIERELSKRAFDMQALLRASGRCESSPWKLLLSFYPSQSMARDWISHKMPHPHLVIIPLVRFTVSVLVKLTISCSILLFQASGPHSFVMVESVVCGEGSEGTGIGASAWLWILEGCLSEEEVRECQRHLETVLTCGDIPIPIPILLFLFPSSSNDSRVLVSQFPFQQMVEKGLISVFCVAPIYHHLDSLQASLQVKDHLIWLISSSPCTIQSLGIMRFSLNQFIETLLSAFFSALSSSPANVMSEMLSQKYNEYLERVKQAVESSTKSLLHLSWPIPELCDSASPWKHPNYTCLLNQVLDGLKVKEKWAGECEGTEAFMEGVWQGLESTQITKDNSIDCIAILEEDFLALMSDILRRPFVHSMDSDSDETVAKRKDDRERHQDWRCDWRHQDLLQDIRNECESSLQFELYLNSLLEK